ncbi:TPA: hypothetical protein L5636_006426, partial [Pseudomonas aeruginosa]|nr:hypothetical protein [Pseudomonas aeruginosa]
NTLPRIDLGAGGELGGSTGTTSPGTDFGADGELGDSARNTLPGPGLGAAGELGVATGNSPLGPGLGAEGYQPLPLNRNRKDVRLNRVCPYGRTRIRAAARAGNPIQRQR